ncbi:MAG: hypothetical protein HY046_03260, partial [Acidobacteria bacterium]|nr:hypothetical protein [Acidobacteriota bacterium]
MTRDSARRTDRVQVNIPVEVSGSDANGLYFTEHTITLVINRYGATLVLTRKLMPEQELVIRNKQNQREAEVNVVGFVAKHDKGDVYGVTFTDPKNNIWDIQFPTTNETKNAAYRLIMECNACKTRKVAYLNESETEVFRASGTLRQKCEKCRESTIWKESSGPVEGDGATVAPPAPAPARTP